MQKIGRIASQRIERLAITTTRRHESRTPGPARRYFALALTDAGIAALKRRANKKAKPPGPVIPLPQIRRSAQSSRSRT